MSFDIQTIRALGREFNFLLNSEIDHIQNVIRSGQFYEIEELELIVEFAGSPKRILDVGANIGNHSIYFAHRFNADLTIPVEPNPAVVPLLRANAGLNWHRSFDLSMVGYGFSDRSATGVSCVSSPANLGGAKLQVDEGGSIPIVSADAALPGMAFDLIKIDVEGMEREVVSGMSAILARSSAVVFIEVLFKNVDSTIAQLSALGYVYTTCYQRYGRCINLLFEKVA
jgi:FkbM family methyltransferase